MPASVASSDDDESLPMGFVDIDELQHHGIGQVDIQRLRANHLHTIGSLQNATTKTLLKIKGFSEVKVEKVREAVRKCLPNRNGFMTLAELAAQRRSCYRISTGSKSWDAILKGGFESRSVNEVYGEYRCGKTQLCHTMAVVAQLPRDQGGAEGKVAILGQILGRDDAGVILTGDTDTEGTFRPERVEEIAKRFGCKKYHYSIEGQALTEAVDPETTIENILYVRAKNSEHQHEVLCNMAEQFSTGEYRLLIVDSIMNLFRSDYQGRGELGERQQKLGIHLRKLVEYAEEFNLTVFMTNQVQSDPGASALFAGADGRKPVGGHVLAHASSTRILLRKGRGEERVAKVMDSPDCPEAEATYVITSGGINDPDKA